MDPRTLNEGAADDARNGRVVQSSTDRVDFGHTVLCYNITFNGFTGVFMSMRILCSLVRTALCLAFAGGFAAPVLAQVTLPTITVYAPSPIQHSGTSTDND